MKKIKQTIVEKQPTNLVEQPLITEDGKRALRELTKGIEETWETDPISRSHATYTIILKQYECIDIDINELIKFFKSKRLVIEKINVKIE